MVFLQKVCYTIAMNIKIYILNLSRSPHRKTHMTEQLNNCPIPYTFVQAIDGKGKKIEEFEVYDSTIRICDFGLDLQPTEIATTASHLKAIQQAYDEGNEWAVILEDDVVVLPTFYNALDSLNCVDESVEVIRLYNREKKPEFKDLTRVEDFSINRFNYKNWGGALGYALNRRAMKKYLDNAYPIVHKADKFIAGTPHFDVKVYQLSPRVLKTTDEIFSDIGYDRGGNKYKGFRNNITRVVSRIREGLMRWIYIIRHFREYF